jgi:tetratricopeptide (TPR) repeat protein
LIGWRGAAAILAMLLLAGGCRRAEAPADCGQNTRSAAGTPPLSYAQLLEQLDREVALARRRAAAQPQRVDLREALASALYQRARLSGNLEDYAAAERAIEAAFDGANEFEAPQLNRALIDFSVHRLDRAEQSLQILQHRILSGGTPEVIGLAADAAFQRGRYAEALAGFRRALSLSESLPGLVRLSTYYARTGAYEEAAALLDRAALNYHGILPDVPAWLEVQQGRLLLERGQLDAADAHFRSADRLLPGLWTAAEQRAEILALRGRREDALSAYEALVQQTGHPEFMDAVARLRREGPDPASAQEWIARGEKTYREQLTMLPEASYGHALEHFLAFGRPAEALELAQRNVALRPNGEARILLAQALFRAGRAAEAISQIEAVLATVWDTAELHAIAAQIYAGTGHKEQADAQGSRAREMNPLALRMYPLPQPALPDLVSMLP